MARQKAEGVRQLFLDVDHINEVSWESKMSQRASLDIYVATGNGKASMELRKRVEAGGRISHYHEETTPAESVNFRIPQVNSKLTYPLVHQRTLGSETHADP